MCGPVRPSPVKSKGYSELKNTRLRSSVISRHEFAHGLDVASRPVAGRVVLLDRQGYNAIAGKGYPRALVL